MRVTAETKTSTRQRIIEVATRLFVAEGWDDTTTRGIAAAAGIAAGTLFNYFDSKEAVVAELLSDALAKAQRELRSRKGKAGSLEEELFALIWTELRSLRPFRKFLPAAAETIFSPLRRMPEDKVGDSIRDRHLDAVGQIIADHGVPDPLPAITMHLYWTLYLGVFAHWAADESPHQEDTLALLDQSLRLFIASLPRRTPGTKGKAARKRGKS